ncbi:MAG TPA: DUF5343 domain-containing protein [Vicinamibacteria bacterium]
MATFAYTTVPGKLKGLMAKIREVGVPKKATVAWLKSIGFTSSNDPSILNVLKQIGFTDGNGVPTQTWRDYRGKNGKAVLAEAIQAGYSELFATYSDAHARPTDDLAAFFRQHTDAGAQAIDKTVSTFKGLTSAADFAAVPARPADDSEETDDTKVVRKQVSSDQAITVNINVQLVLPESADEDFYRKFFAAMREYLVAPAK